MKLALETRVGVVVLAVVALTATLPIIRLFM